MVIADMFGVSQPTICRIWRRITEILETVLVFTSGGVEEAVTIWGSSCWSTAPTLPDGESASKRAGRCKSTPGNVKSNV